MKSFSIWKKIYQNLMKQSRLQIWTDDPLIWPNVHCARRSLRPPRPKNFPKIFFMILLGMYVSLTTILMTKILKKIIDLAQMKNPENSQFPPFLLGFEDFCIDEQKWIRREIFSRWDKSLNSFAYANSYVNMKNQKVSDHSV